MSDTFNPIPPKGSFVIVDTVPGTKPYTIGDDPLKDVKPTDDEIQEWVDLIKKIWDANGSDDTDTE